MKKKLYLPVVICALFLCLSGCGKEKEPTKEQISNLKTINKMSVEEIREKLPIKVDAKEVLKDALLEDDYSVTMAVEYADSDELMLNISLSGSNESMTAYTKTLYSETRNEFYDMNGEYYLKSSMKGYTSSHAFYENEYNYKLGNYSMSQTGTVCDMDLINLESTLYDGLCEAYLADITEDGRVYSFVYEDERTSDVFVGNDGILTSIKYKADGSEYEFTIERISQISLPKNTEWVVDRSMEVSSVILDQVFGVMLDGAEVKDEREYVYSEDDEDDSSEELSDEEYFDEFILFDEDME